MGFFRQFKIKTKKKSNKHSAFATPPPHFQKKLLRNIYWGFLKYRQVIAQVKKQKKKLKRERERHTQTESLSPHFFTLLIDLKKPIYNDCCIFEGGLVELLSYFSKYCWPSATVLQWLLRAAANVLPSKPHPVNAIFFLLSYSQNSNAEKITN